MHAGAELIHRSPWGVGVREQLMTPGDCHRNRPGETDRPGIPAPSVAIVLICLITGGCTVFSQDDASLKAAPPPPEGKRLAELTASAFAAAKLAGTPEVSPVRATHDSQWGDWMFCITSNSPAGQGKYAVLIGHDAVLDVRSSVLIDGCDKETYHPLETADQKAKPNSKPGGRPATPHPQAANRQTGAL
jgi:hypothetical protein